MRSYMIIPCPPEAETEGYQYRMLEMNRIKGLLPCGLRYIDGERYLYYDISGKQSMQGLYEGRKIAGNELFNLFRDMERVCGSLAGYLLDEQHLVLSKEQVFYDFGSGNYYFTYYPGAVTEPDIFQFIADSIDGADKRAAAAAYRICMAAGGDRQALRAAIRREAAQKDHPGPYEEDLYQPEQCEANPYKAEPYEVDPYNADTRKANPYDADPYEVKLQETQEDRLPQRQKKDKPYIKETADSLSSEEREREEGGQSFGKKQITLRILLIVMLLAGAGGLIAVPFLLYVSDRERRLCIAGAILLLAATGLLVAELILKLRSKRRGRKEDDRNRQPVYSVSDEKDMPMFGADRKREYRLMDDSDVTIRFSGQEMIGRLYGREHGNRIDLRTLPVTIGKAQAYADFVLADPSVSRVHARIYKGEDGGIEIRDLNSTNGTWINGVRLEPNEKVRVQRGDEVRFGNVEYEYR